VSGGLSLVPRPFAPDGSLTARLLAGRGPVELPTPATAPVRAAGPSRLGIETFGTTSPRVREKLDRVLAGEGLVVTTGQQPVLFLGPMYVLYKALTAIAVAQRLEERFRVPVVPVFWIASDDHDWDEIGRTSLLDRHHELQTITLAPAHQDAGRSAGPAKLGPDVKRLISEMSQYVPESEFTAMYIELLRDAYRQDCTVSEAFSTALGGVLDGRELAWVDSASASLRQAAVPLLSRFVAHSDEIIDAMEAGATALAQGGVEAPIPSLPGGLPLFYDGDGRRERLYVEGGDIRAGREGASAPSGTWLERLADRPESFSPNVTTRPVLESYLMPVAATVLGPSEIAYWSQLPPVFEWCGVSFPAIVPRVSWTVLEARVARVLEKVDIDLEDLADGGDAAVSRVTEDARPEAVDAGFRTVRAALSGEMEILERALIDEFPGLRGAVGKTRKGLSDLVTALERQVDAEARRRHDTVVEQIHRAAQNVFPARKPQERVLSPFYFLSRYGPAVIDLIDDDTRARVSESLAAPGAGG
jgi:bacillithiol biosynthesis cysteine-adding enzyme BshC